MRLIWSGPAQTDLMKIDRWLTSHADADIAESQLQQIRARVRRLVDFPRSAAIFSGEKRHARVPKTRYVIVYQVADRVDILRIRHNREDWRELK